MVGVPRWNCARSWKVCSITIARRSKTYRRAICSDNKNLLRQVFVFWWRWMWLSLKMWSRYYNGFQNAIRSLRCPSRWMPIRNWFLMWLLASWLSNKFWMFSMWSRPLKFAKKCPASWRISTLLTIPPPQTRSPCGQSKSHRVDWTQVYPTGRIPLKTAASKKWGSGFVTSSAQCISADDDQCSWCDTTFRTCWSVCTGHIPASFALRTSSRMVCSNRPSCCCSFPDRAGNWRLNHHSVLSLHRLTVPACLNVARILPSFLEQFFQRVQFFTGNINGFNDGGSADTLHKVKHAHHLGHITLCPARRKVAVPFRLCSEHQLLRWR